MNTHEFLKEIYENAKSNYEYMRSDNYRFSFDKLRNLLWVNLVLFTSLFFIVKLLNFVPVETYILIFINIFTTVIILNKTSSVRDLKNKPQKPEDIGFTKDVDWIYNKVIKHKQKEEVFYVDLIKEMERAIFKENERVVKNNFFYSGIILSIIIQSTILIFAFIKYSSGG